MKYGFAGDRQISVNILKFLIGKGYQPSFLLVGENGKSSHAQALIEASGLSADNVFTNKDLNNSDKLSALRAFDVDYIFGIHFPYIIKKALLELPKVGFINLHPAYLPYNKGWHTPSWAILEGTRYGATLHFMSEVLDGGDIIAQAELTVSPSMTANGLYAAALQLEQQLFFDNFDNLLTLNPTRQPQTEIGTTHHKKDLEQIQPINVEEKVYPLDLINKLRALTTNNLNEAAYVMMDGKKFAIQVNIVEL